MVKSRRVVRKDCGMKTNECLLITFASWEDRFKLGFRRDLDCAGVGRALVLYFENYADRTQRNRDDVESACRRDGIECTWEPLDVADPVKNWNTVAKAIGSAASGCQRVLVDISTMPREIIWHALWLAEDKAAELGYVYHCPEGYGKDWLSRDPRAPRLVYKLSGIALPSRKTALVVTAGFDLQRAVRLIEWFEPSVLLVGLQSKSRFTRNYEAMKNHRDRMSKEYDCKFFELDAYSDDRGLATIQRELGKIDETCNIVMSSLGPKLTAITLYELQRARPEVGLAYAPATEFSGDYSFGIGESLWGTCGI